MMFYTRLFVGMSLLLLIPKCEFAIAQESQNPHAEAINRYLTSPKAGEIFRHGNVPINLSGGQISYGVPIHTVKVGDFSWPVSLNYAYNGLLLEAKSTGVGLGWSLSGGGAVVRQVRGLPDEHVRGYWGAFNTTHRGYIDGFTGPGSMPLNIVKDFVSGMNDSEPDKFSLSAGPLSVTFFIANLNDPGGCPYGAYNVTSTAEGVKICFSWDRIEATDASGVIYSFGVKDLSQFTSSHQENADYMQTYPSAWHLDAIRLPNGRQINFGYQSKQVESKSYSESFSRTANDLGVDVTIDCAALGGTFNSNYQGIESFRELSYSSSSITTMLTSNYLDGISWDEGSLVITYGTGEAAYELPRINMIEIKDPSNVRRHVVNLTYDSQPRELLASVAKDTVETYSFEYNRVFVGYPQGTPYAQDFWGFANGKPNTSAIPEKGGNRYPDFTTASQGALTRINYPTGGSTEIKYEPNEVKIATADLVSAGPPMDGPNMHFGTQSSSLPLNQNFSEEHTLVITRPTYAMINHSGVLTGNSSVLNMSFGAAGCNPDVCGDYVVKSKFERSIRPGKVPAFNPTATVGLTGDVDNTYTGTNCGTYRACSFGSLSDWILMGPGTYTLTVSGYNAGYVGYSFNLEYYDPGQGDTVNMKAAGIRVKSTKDCPSASVTGCTTKEFSYLTPNGLSSGKYLSKIDYSYPYVIHQAHNCLTESGNFLTLPKLVEYSVPAISFSFRTLNPIEFHAGSPVYYQQVNVIENGKGKDVQYFHNSTYGLQGDYPYVPIPENPINGAAYKKESYDQTPALVRQVVLTNQVTNPSLNLSLFPKGMLFGIKHEYTYVPVMDANDFITMLLSVGYHYVKYEVEKPSKLLLMNEKDKYFPLPQVKESIYTYDSKLFSSTAEIIDSKGNSSKKKFYYPYDISDPGYTELINVNKIGRPVKTEEYYNGNLQKSTQTFYQKWFTTPKPIVEPLRIESSIGGSTFVEATVNSISTQGNLLEVTPRNGVKGSLLWGYNGMFPIADVQNASQGSFAFTSFEEDANGGGWSYNNNPTTAQSKTGSRSHLFSATAGSVSRTGLVASTTYTLSYWAKGGLPAISGGVQVSNDAPVESDGWTYYEKTITGVTSITITAAAGIFLDELRIYPKSASMTTFTYKSLVGITTQTDPNNRITYYEYDGAGRLARIKDHDRNIIKKFDYGYKALPAINNY